MSKFSYKAEGDLNSKYLLDLLKEYLSTLLITNDTNGIEDDDYKINPNANKFVLRLKDIFKRIGFKFKHKDLVDNYNKVLTLKHISAIKDKIDIFMQTNVLEAQQFIELKEILKSINFTTILPLLDYTRQKSIKRSQAQFLKVLNNIKYLKWAKTEYVLYNSPVQELKPFLSEKVSVHNVNFVEIEKLAKQFVNYRYNELTDTNFKPKEIKFKVRREDFYDDNITDSGVGEEVESFIRSNMLKKLEISKQDHISPEEIAERDEQIDKLLKRLKVGKIEKLMQQLIDLKTNLAQVKEVLDKCKDTINLTTFSNKSQIFLEMDNLYYNLSKKCDTLQQKIKLKLQLVDKQKLFSTLELLQNPDNKKSNKTKALNDENAKILKRPTTSKPNKKENNNHITSNLYDEDDDGEIHITEDDNNDDAEEEIVIEDN